MTIERRSYDPDVVGVLGGFSAHMRKKLDPRIRRASATEREAAARDLRAAEHSLSIGDVRQAAPEAAVLLVHHTGPRCEPDTSTRSTLPGVEHERRRA